MPYYQPVVAYGAPPVVYPPAQPTNGLAVAALVVGILAFLGSLVPILGIGAILLGVVGVILGIVGLTKHYGKGMAIAGVVLSAIALIIGSIQLAVVGVFANRVTQTITAVHTVSFSATVASGTANAAYLVGLDTGNADFTSSWLHEGQGTAADVIATLFVSGTSSGASNQYVTCKIVVDGKTVDSQAGLGTVNCAASLLGP